jgi:hypothetical protein
MAEGSTGMEPLRGLKGSAYIPGAHAERACVPESSKPTRPFPGRRSCGWNKVFDVWKTTGQPPGLGALWRNARVIGSVAGVGARGARLRSHSPVRKGSTCVGATNRLELNWLMRGTNVTIADQNVLIGVGAYHV